MTVTSPSAVNGEAPLISGAGRYPRYPDYRETGVGWLGEIPAHWQVKRTRHVARLESGHTPSRNNSEYWQDCNIPWFTLADVWQIRRGGKDVVTETKEQISEMGLAHSAARLLPKDTVILSRTASVGFSAIAGVDLATTQDYVNWVCKSDLRPEYLLLVFRSMNSEFQRLTMGSTHRTIYMPDVRSFSTPLPTIEEQESIVSFVRFETEKIDALVAKKERLIELLHEKRAALITRTVTKGIDPDAPMKDSGVKWLADIPERWNTARMWQLSEAISGGTPSRDEPRYWGGLVPWVSPKDMKRRLLDDTEEKITERGRTEGGLRLVRPPAVLIVVRGMILAHSFPVALASVPLTINQDMKALKLGEGVDARYFGWLLDGIAHQILGTHSHARTE